ncbi:DUF7504 family protein [Haloglomus halophilum]|jgi:hypothetical protein|uniref:DUF7504 family protein n=1 Tax=Haloglomus halophilum TaxID=2962672 RepID=UPI0020C9A8A7|nr:hypothetical protein [Haloglomus halophilum]
MDGPPEVTSDEPTLHIDTLPERVEDGATVLVATAGDPSRLGVCLELLYQRGTAADSALVVTTVESAEATHDRYGRLAAGRAGPALRIVDTVSEGQSVSALYGETPVVFTPNVGDLERLVIALSDLAGEATPSDGARHLVIRSLTPMLDAVPADRVCTVLERIVELRTGGGLCLLGIDYTAHDEETMRTIAAETDGVLWATEQEPDRVEFAYEPSGGRYQYLESRRDGR